MKTLQNLNVGKPLPPLASTTSHHKKSKEPALCIPRSTVSLKKARPTGEH